MLVAVTQLCRRATVVQLHYVVDSGVNGKPHFVSFR